MTTPMLFSYKKTLHYFELDKHQLEHFEKYGSVNIPYYVLGEGVITIRVKSVNTCLIDTPTFHMLREYVDTYLLTDFMEFMNRKGYGNNPKRIYDDYAEFFV